MEIKINGWCKLRYDVVGLATDESLDEALSCIPIMLYSVRDNTIELVDSDNAIEYRGIMERYGFNREYVWRPFS